MKKQIGLLVFFLLLLVTSVFAAYRYYEPYYGGGYGYGSLSMYFDMFLDFIEANEFLVDAIVFLIIFLVVCKKVFADSFSDQKLLYIVVGIALTIGIIMYERRTGYSFIIHAGWVSMVILFGMMAYVASTSELTNIKMVVLGILGFVAISYASFMFPQIYYMIPPFIPMLLMVGFFVMIVYGFVKGFLEARGGGGVVDMLMKAVKGFTK